jgi:lipopolysaccharide transport system permease protein
MTIATSDHSLDSKNDVVHIRIRADDIGKLIDIPELLRYGELLMTLAERDLRVRYKQTVLGVVWVVMQPLMASLIFAFVFGVVAGLPSRGMPYVLVAFAGMLGWSIFSNIVSRGSMSLLSNSQMISRIYFPRLVLPLAAAAAALVDSTFSLGLMSLMLACFRVWPGWGALLLPVWIAIMVFLALGFALISSSLMVRYRDINHIIPVALQMGLYISPVALSMQNVPEKYRWVLWLNPLSGPLEAIRWSLLGTHQGVLSLSALAYAITAAATFFWVGLAVFKRQERSFADVI